MIGQLWILLSFVFPPSPRMVLVKTCGGSYADIYSDKELTMRIPNPFVAFPDGSYKFSTSDKCVQVSVK